MSNWVFAFLQRSATGLSVVVRSYAYYTKRDRHDNILASIRLCFRVRPNGPRVDEREQCQVIVLEVPQPMPDRPSLVHHSLEHCTWSNASTEASTTALPGAGEGCSPAWSNASCFTRNGSRCSPSVDGIGAFRESILDRQEITTLSAGSLWSLFHIGCSEDYLQDQLEQ